ncbi:MAG: helix-hairpin-helix domain-containing protein [Oscillospiraceae bacterium]|nr:helix-hairpin-helix domain-containing protein [Oscillospiraceae bacterium]
MKLSKAEIAAVIITVVFVAFTVIFSIPGNSGDMTVTVSAQKTGEEGQAALQLSPPSESSDSAIVNINTATAAELACLPEIGEKLAERIIAYRDEHGPFNNKDEIMSVSGIGAKTYEDIKDCITAD